MRECLKHTTLNMVRELKEAPLRVHFARNHKRVGNETTHLVQLGPASVRCWYTHGKLLLPTEPVDQQLISRHQHDK